MDMEKLRFQESHEWALIEGDVCTVGITQFAADQLTDITALDLKKVGTKVTAGKDMGQLETVKAVEDIYAPVDGEIAEVNQAVVDDPEGPIKSDPFGAGWMVKIKMADGAGLGHLKTWQQYQGQLSQEEH